MSSALSREPPRDYHSFSSLRLYASCPLRYYFRYVLGLPESQIASSLAFGVGVHRALEGFYQTLLEGGAEPTLDELLDSFWAGWHADDGREIAFKKDEDLTDVGRLAEAVIRAFLGSETRHVRGTVLGVEEPVRGVLVPGLPDFVARLDLVVDAGDELTVTDFKTSRSAWSADQAEDAGDQLLLYRELMSDWADGRPIRLEFLVATKTKTPTLTRHPVNTDPRRVKRMKATFERIALAIADERFFPNPSPMNCPSCPYRAPCRAWAG